MQNQIFTCIQKYSFYIFCLINIFVPVLFFEENVYGKEVFQSTVRILSSSGDARVLTTLPKERQIQNQPILSSTQTNAQNYSHNTITNSITSANSTTNSITTGSVIPHSPTSDSATAGFYFNMANPHGPSITFGGFANGTSLQNTSHGTSIRRSQSQIIRVDKNNMPITSFSNLPQLEAPAFSSFPEHTQQRQLSPIYAPETHYTTQNHLNLNNTELNNLEIESNLYENVAQENSLDTQQIQQIQQIQNEVFMPLSD